MNIGIGRIEVPEKELAALRRTQPLGGGLAPSAECAKVLHPQQAEARTDARNCGIASG
jgi:hypothetical protein